MKLTLRVISALLFIVGIIWMIDSPGFDALTAFLTGILTLLTSFLIDNKQATETLDQRNRRVLLGHVENFWVKGVLENSLHGAVLLELGIKEDHKAVTYPWGMKKEGTDDLLPSGKSMLEIFEQIGMGRSLLILGAPGSGKTTMLLELARQLIERARQNETDPIPMVFNLTSWTEKQTLPDWLAQELNTMYNVPKKIAPDWITGNKLFLLLDGLDEVQLESRAKCVDTINQFRKDHGLTSLVVCSRLEEYARIDTKISLDGAIILQALTLQQVSAYLNKFGKRLEGVKQLLRTDTALQELAETPLMLSIVSIVYKDKSIKELRDSGSSNDHRKHLFNAYISHMFQRSSKAEIHPFTKEKTLAYLGWLARKMIALNSVPFFIEAINVAWLGDEINRNVLSTLDRFRVKSAAGFLETVSQEKLGTIYELHWSWKNAIQSMLVNLKYSIYIGLAFGFIASMGQIFTGNFNGWIGVILFTLSVFFIPIVISLARGMISKDVGLIRSPGQGIKQLKQNLIISTLLYGVIGVVSFSPGWFYNLSPALSKSTIYFIFDFFMVFGLIGFLTYGGAKIVQHDTLLNVLKENNFIPWKIVPFLDYCTDLIFLRRVGGGYIFIHRLLMEHFAEMYDENNKAVTIDTL